MFVGGELSNVMKKNENVSLEIVGKKWGKKKYRKKKKQSPEYNLGLYRLIISTQ